MNDQAKQANEAPAENRPNTDGHQPQSKFEVWWKPYDEPIRQALPRGKSLEAFKASVRLAAMENPDLQQCTPASMLTALLQIARLGLAPDRRNAYLIPYKQTAQAEIDYKGLIAILIESKVASKILSDVVYEGDKLFKREDEWVHEVADGLSLERGKPAGAIAVVYLTSGERITEWMPQSEIDQARSCSKSAHKDASPWKKWPGEMAKKTCLRRLMKKLPLDADKAAAIAEIETAEFGALLDRPARIGQSTATYEGSLGVDGIKNNLRDREASR